MLSIAGLAARRDHASTTTRLRYGITPSPSQMTRAEAVMALSLLPSPGLPTLTPWRLLYYDPRGSEIIATRPGGVRSFPAFAT